MEEYIKLLHAVRERREEGMNNELLYSCNYEPEGFQSLRHCPTCDHKMHTYGDGRFWCVGCGYRDNQKVDKLFDAGLDYPAQPGRNLMTGFGKKWE